MTGPSGGAEAKPELAVNRDGRTVADALRGFITHAATDFVGGAELDIATAYFNIGGYMLLADALDCLTGTRILVGAEPAPPETRRRKLGVESPRPERAVRARLSQALADHQRDLTIERDMLFPPLRNAVAALDEAQGTQSREAVGTPLPRPGPAAALGALRDAGAGRSRPRTGGTGHPSAVARTAAAPTVCRRGELLSGLD